MRPNSIIMFERLFLASLVVGLVGLALTYQQSVDALANDPATAALGLGGGALLGIVVFSYAISLLLWYFIARRASTVAKWIFIVILALGLVSLVGVVTGPWTLETILNVVVYGLEVVAAGFLFQPDAKAWFASRGAAADPDTFA